MQQNYYLKPNVKLEPLVWQWYAWSYLITPITSAKLTAKHVKLMESYLTAPELHYKTAIDPNMPGGAFLGINPENREQVAALLKDRKESGQALLQLANEFKEFDLFLQKNATGHSLESLYSQLPDTLKGCVELIYDYNNQPSIRIIEALFYRKYYQMIRDGQAVVLSESETDDRPFAFSTPRLSNKNELYLKIAFDSKKIDFISRLRREAFDLETIYRTLDLNESQRQHFFKFLTPNFERIYKPVQDDGVRVRYFGHACVLLETKNVSILIDPLINYKHATSANCFTINDLPDKIDYVLITHGHQDHIVIETLLQLRDRIGTIIVPRNQIGCFIDPSLKLLLQQIGFNSIIAVDELDTITIADGEIIAVPFLGEHADLNILAKMAYAITLKGRKLLFCADSNNIDNNLYELFHKCHGEIDYLFIGMECEGAPMGWFFNGIIHKLPNKEDNNSRRFSGSNCDKAWKMIQTLKCKSIFVYAMAMEPWLTHIMALDYREDSPQIIESNKLIELCQKHNLEVVKPYIKMEKVI